MARLEAKTFEKPHGFILPMPCFKPQPLLAVGPRLFFQPGHYGLAHALAARGGGCVQALYLGIIVA